MNQWTLFSNHGHVLVCLARNPETRLRDVAADVGITERAVQKIVRDLQDCGMLSVSKHGRRNRYRIHHKQTLRHDLEAHCTVGGLVKFVNLSIPGAKPGVKEAEPEVGVAESPAARVEQIQSVPDQPERTEPPQTPPEFVKPEPPKKKQARPVVENSIKKQQGSLF
jgi:predicted transcriptional regulator